MFDIGFTEILLVGVVILVVVGPERLPKVARTAGMWFGKARGFLASVKADIDSELKADELKRILDEQAQSSGIHEIIEASKDAADNLNQASAKFRQKVSDEQAAIWSERVAANRAKTATEDEPEYLVKAQDDTTANAPDAPGAEDAKEKP